MEFIKNKNIKRIRKRLISDQPPCLKTQGNTPKKIRIDLTSEFDHPHPEEKIQPNHPHPQMKIQSNHPHPQIKIEIDHPHPQMKIESNHPHPEEKIESNHPHPQIKIESNHPHPEEKIESNHPHPEEKIQSNHPCPEEKIQSNHPHPQMKIEIDHPHPQIKIEIDHPHPEEKIESNHPHPQIKIQSNHPHPEEKIESNHPYPEEKIQSNHPCPQKKIEIDHPYPEEKIQSNHPHPQMKIQSNHPHPEEKIESNHPHPEEKIQSNHPHPEEKIQSQPERRIQINGPEIAPEENQNGEQVNMVSRFRRYHDDNQYNEKVLLQKIANNIREGQKKPYDYDDISTYLLSCIQKMCFEDLYLLLDQYSTNNISKACLDFFIFEKEPLGRICWLDNQALSFYVLYFISEKHFEMFYKVSFCCECNLEDSPQWRNVLLQNQKVLVNNNQYTKEMPSFIMEVFNIASKVSCDLNKVNFKESPIKRVIKGQCLSLGLVSVSHSIFEDLMNLNYYQQFYFFLAVNFLNPKRQAFALKDVTKVLTLEHLREVSDFLNIQPGEEKLFKFWSKTTIFLVHYMVDGFPFEDTLVDDYNEYEFEEDLETKRAVSLKKEIEWKSFGLKETF